MKAGGTPTVLGTPDYFRERKMKLCWTTVLLLKEARPSKWQAWSLENLPLEPSVGRPYWKSRRPERSCGYLEIHLLDVTLDGLRPEGSKAGPFPLLLQAVLS